MKPQFWPADPRPIPQRFERPVGSELTVLSTLLRPAGGVALGAAIAWAATVVFDPADAANLRMWACLAGVSAFLHVPEALAARGPIGALARLTAAGLQFTLAAGGISHQTVLVAAAFLVGAGGAAVDAVRADRERAGSPLVPWIWTAFQALAAMLWLVR